MSEFGNTISSGIVRKVLGRPSPLTAETSGVFQFPEAPPLNSSDWHQVVDKTELWQLSESYPTATAYIRLNDSILLLESARGADGRITNTFTLTHIDGQKVSPIQIQK